MFESMGKNAPPQQPTTPYDHKIVPNVQSYFAFVVNHVALNMVVQLIALKQNRFGRQKKRQ